MPKEPKRVANEKLEVLKTRVNSMFNKLYKNKMRVRESKMVIKRFAKQYVIDGIEGVDAIPFLRRARNEVLNLLANNCMIKFNLVLYCEMEHVNMKRGRVINTVAPFLSNTKVVLEATNVGELYSKAFEKIIESMAMFQI